MVDRGLNGIQVYEPSGVCVLRMRFIGGPSYIVAETLPDVETAKQLREATIRKTAAPPSAIGITKYGRQWRAQVKHRKTNYPLGDFLTEREAADCRLAFDAWSEYQPAEAIYNALQDHNRTRNNHYD